MTEDIDAYRVPLVVGVTGHRDLVPEETATIKQRVRTFFEGLQAEYPTLPLMVMTPLAEGADRIAAEVAEELGIPCVILLPMPRQIYQSDFQGDSLVEFHKMLEIGEVVELPLLDGASRDDVATPGHARDMQYAQLGAYLAAHSHILLAVWDGKPSAAPGGTGHVIHFHQHDVIELIAEGQHRSPIDFSEDESDLVYHVVCSRLEAGPPVDPLVPGDVHWFTRDDFEPRTREMPARYKVVFERMAEFSKDMRTPTEEGAFYELLPEEEMRKCNPGARDIAHLYNKVDYLARRYQKLAMTSLRLAFAFAILAGLCFIVYADMPEQELMIYPYLLFVVAVVAMFAIDARRGWQRKHLDYRVLAEGLRVQFYWSVAGIVMENASRFSHDSFLKRQDLELGWIRNIMRFAGRRADSQEHGDSEWGLELVIQEWVGDEQHGQIGYYQRKSMERSNRNRWTGRLGVVSYVLLMVVALILAVYQWNIHAPWSNVLVAMMGLLPLIATVRQNYAHRTAEHELILQYAYMHRIFRNAHRLLQSVTDLTGRQEILRALGEAQLDENGQWLLRQRERPIGSGQLMQGG